MPRTRRRPNSDGRANNGGARQGTPGTPYANRSDLRQAPTAATGQEYGQAGRQLAAQRAVPLPAAPPPPNPAASSGGAAGGGAPPAPLDFFRPTDRPTEPLTHGLPTGPGAGPDILPTNAAMTDPLAIQIRALYQRFPSQELADLLMDL